MVKAFIKVWYSSGNVVLQEIQFYRFRKKRHCIVGLERVGHGLK